MGLFENATKWLGSIGYIGIYLDTFKILEISRILDILGHIHGVGLSEYASGMGVQRNGRGYGRARGDWWLLHEKIIEKFKKTRIPYRKSPPDKRGLGGLKVKYHAGSSLHGNLLFFALFSVEHCVKINTIPTQAKNALR